MISHSLSTLKRKVVTKSLFYYLQYRQSHSPMQQNGHTAVGGRRSAPWCVGRQSRGPSLATCVDMHTHARHIRHQSCTALLCSQGPSTHTLARHKPHRARDMREACAIEVCVHTAVERGVRERQRMRLCCVKNVAASVATAAYCMLTCENTCARASDGRAHM